MEVRFLTEAEIDLLPRDKQPDPEYTDVVGAFADGELIGWAFLVKAVFLEEPYVHPKFRGSMAASLMHKTIMKSSLPYGLPKLLAAPNCCQHMEYLNRLGYEPYKRIWAKDKENGRTI